MMWVNPLEQSSKVLIEQPVLELIRRYRQDGATSLEAGGIFLGFRRDAHLHIVEATTPFPTDHRSRFRFSRRDRNHQNVATRQWRSTGGTMDYLGEWHTHPEEHPQPSSLDRSEWMKICRGRMTTMVFAIVGLSDTVWLGVGLNGDIVPGPMAVSVDGQFTRGSETIQEDSIGA